MVGAGPAGAHAAATMARGGVKVLLIDRRAKGQAGAQWVNGVAAWMFDEAGVQRPEPPENLGGGHRFTLLSPSGAHRVDIDDHPVLEVDMRLLGQRLAQGVVDAGGDVFWEAQLDEVVFESSDRPVALMVSRSVDGQMTRQRVSARLFVDASGLVAALRREVPSLEASCEQVGAEDLCVAAQEVRHVSDEEAAAAWLERHSASVGQTLAWTGLNGGFSVLNVRVSPGMKHVGILTGSIVGSPFPSGRRILDSFVKEEGWIGEKVFGGSRAIPLRRPYTRLISPGVALLGDAACQVFTAHGSGIGIGLIAGRMLADAAIEAVAAGEDPGSLTGLWRYPTRFHRRWGGLLASTDVFRRFSQCLSEDDLETMMSSGLISPKMASANLGQQPPKVSIQDLPKLIAAASKAPALLMRLLPVLLRAPVIEAAARTYPRLDRPHAEVALFRYERWMQWLVDSVDFGGSRSGGR